MKKRILLAGKAASGKDFFRDYMKNLGFDIDVSYSTRPMRAGEIDGYTYNFISREQFQNLLHGNNMFEHVEFAGMLYGTSRENWEKCDVFIFTPSGLSQVPEEDRKDCVVIYFDIPYEVRKERLKERSDFDSVGRRLEADEKDFENFTDFDLRITNPQYNPDVVFQLARTMRTNEV